jgi:signal peptidase II
MALNPRKRITMIVSFLIGYVALDQFSKYLAKKMLLPGSIIRFLGDSFRLQYAENKGIYLSIGSGLSDETRFWLFTVAVSVLLAVLFLFLIFSKHLTFFPTFSLTLILCGGIGNLIDRLFRQGVVIDMFNLGIGNLRTGIFNLADLAITFGGAMMIYYLLFIERREHAVSSGKAKRKTEISKDEENNGVDEI